MSIITLSPKARQVLRTLYRELLQVDVVKKKRTRYINEVLDWCHQADLVRSSELQSEHFYFRKGLIERVEDLLAATQAGSIKEGIHGDRLQQALITNAEHKGVGDKPKEHRVLLAFPKSEIGLPAGFSFSEHAQDWVYLDALPEQINLQRFKELVIVENLDCFYKLHRFQLSFSTDSLIIYRGDSDFGAGVARMRKDWLETGKPLKLFADLDPKSMHEALTSGYTHLAVPALLEFLHKATKAQWRDEQVAYMSIESDGPIKPYLEHGKNKQRALLQQWLQGIELHWLDLRGH